MFCGRYSSQTEQFEENAMGRFANHRIETNKYCPWMFYYILFFYNALLQYVGET